MKSLFEVSTICRLCLKVDVKVFRLDNIHHKAFVESIFKLKQFNYIPTDDQYVCYICNALLSKTFNFIQTVWKAQEIVCYLLKNTDKITKPMIELIDRCENGLNPITLSSFVVICENELIYDSCDDGNLNKNKINEKTEAKKVQVLIKTEGKQSKLVQKYKKNRFINEIDNHPTNESIYDSSSSSEDINEPSKCYSDDIEVEIYDPLVDNVNEGSVDPLEENNKKKSTEETTKYIDKDAHNLKTVSLKKKSQFLQKTRSYKYKSDSQDSSEFKSSDSDEKDYDYQPDSTSHSEDSEYNSYDKKGKLIRKPKDNRVYPRQCDHCNYEVQKKYDHYHHYQFVHPNIEYPYQIEKNYACLICGKLLAKQNIRTHEARHTNQKMKCSLCPKVFPYKKLLYQHVLRVHPTKTFTCDYCSKTFKTRTDLIRHIRIHTGSKPFKCHICGDGFAHSGNRTIHIRNKHQNYKDVHKKQKRTKKVRKNYEQETTDTEITLSDEVKKEDDQKY